MTVKLTRSQMYDLVCVICERADELTQDGLCVWCQRCGPSSLVQARRLRPAYLSLSPEAPASSKEEADG